MIESKLIQVNKKKIAYIYVILKNVVYLHRIRARILVLHNEAIYIYPLGVCMVIPFAFLRCKEVILFNK